VLPTKLCTVFCLIVALSPTRLNATTFVVILATNGLVVSSDSQTAFFHLDEPSSTKTKDQRKFFIVQNRIVVGLIGVANIDNPSFHYDFLTWMQTLQSKFPKDVSVDDVAEAIERESPAAFANFVAESVTQGTVKRVSADQLCLSVAKFVIVGYQEGIPRLYEVHFDIDWNNQKLLGPIKLLLHPEPGNISDYRVLHLGVDEAIADIRNGQSYAYHQATILCPRAVNSVFRRIGTYPSLDDTISFSRAMIQIEKNTNPSEVGGTIRTVKILPNGRADEVINKTSALSKTHSRKSEKQH